MSHHSKLLDEEKDSLKPSHQASHGALQCFQLIFNWFQLTFDLLSVDFNLLLNDAQFHFNWCSVDFSFFISRGGYIYFLACEGSGHSIQLLSTPQPWSSPTLRWSSSTLRWATSGVSWGIIRWNGFPTSARSCLWRKSLWSLGLGIVFFRSHWENQLMK